MQKHLCTADAERGEKGRSSGGGIQIMKTKYLFLVIAALVILAGCATKQIVTPAVPYQPAITNVVTGAVTPEVATVREVIAYVPNATVAKIAATGAQVAPLVPAPWGDVLAGLLGLSTVIIGIIARQKNGQLKTTQEVTKAIIQGVESAGSAAATVKMAIATVSKANGVADAVEAHVNDVVGSH